MPWQDVMTTLLRHTINDVDDPQLYTDNRLQLAILTGAQFVNTEFDWKPNQYQISLPTLSISPDPTNPVNAGDQWLNLNNWFMNLVILKTSIIMFGNNLRTASMQAFAIKDIDVTVDLRAMATVNKQILDEMKEYYAEIGKQYRIGVRSPGQAILGPINILAGNWMSTQYGYGDSRSRVIW